MGSAHARVQTDKTRTARTTSPNKQSRSAGFVVERVSAIQRTRACYSIARVFISWSCAGFSFHIPNAGLCLILQKHSILCFKTCFWLFSDIKKRLNIVWMFSLSTHYRMSFSLLLHVAPLQSVYPFDWATNIIGFLWLRIISNYVLQHIFRTCLWF